MANKVVIRIGMDEVTVTIKEANADRTGFVGVDKTGSLYHFRKNQVVRKVKDS